MNSGGGGPGVTRVAVHMVRTLFTQSWGYVWVRHMFQLLEDMFGALIDAYSYRYAGLGTGDFTYLAWNTGETIHIRSHI